MLAHITLAFLFLPLGIAFTRHHSRQLHLNPTDLDPDNTGPVDCDATSGFVARTLMIANIPLSVCQKVSLIRLFEEAYPNVEVRELQLAYSIKNLISMDYERELVKRARLFCEDYVEKNGGTRLMMTPYACGVICCCCEIFGCKKVDALEYYSEMEKQLQQRVDQKKLLICLKPTGVAFVTLGSRNNAIEILKDHKTMTGRCPIALPVPGASRLHPRNWNVRQAPDPANIYWKNLSVTTYCWWAKAILINLILFVVFFFLTTPAVIVSLLEDYASLTDKLEQKGQFLAEVLPSLLMMIMAALMPMLVAYSDQFMRHWTRTSRNHAVMWKTFLFLVLMVIILPSLGLTSAEGLVELIANPRSNNGGYRWECIFLPDNGAFFVNYIITSAFIGTSLELLRPSDTFTYCFRWCLMRSKAEIASVRRNILSEFSYGLQYAWMLLIFAMTMMYSLSCPLITPFGLLYMLFKHLVDKYNICFAYKPSRIGKNIHVTAVNFVIASIVLQQLCLFFFAWIHGRYTTYALTLFCTAICVGLAYRDRNNVEVHNSSELRNCEESLDAEASFAARRAPGLSIATVGTYGSRRTNFRLETRLYVPNVLKDNHRL